jgi:hypothetical protein
MSVHTHAAGAHRPAFAGLEILQKIGEGRRCAVFEARTAEDTSLALKLYWPSAIDKHACHSRIALARYEYEQNAALYAIGELRPFIALPVAYFVSQRLQAMLQERVAGEPLAAYVRRASAPQRRTLRGQIGRLVEVAHAAGRFDLDLQPHNVIVRRSVDGEPRPVLFDFNKIPYHVRPPNAVCAILLGMRLLSPESRDRRYRRRLNRLCAGGSDA